MNFRQALAELDARQPERMVPDLSRITALAELMDHPERTYPTIHVTGTNGKTTTARLITSLACAHDLSAGTYTSPHLESVNERLSLCGEPISEQEFGEEYDRLLPYLREVDAATADRVTYFETLTALAYLWFADKPVQLGVFEVGMGGVWDATNLIAGDVAVLCPIALDHPELGSTVAEVAAEKAGIIKPGKIAVCREQPEEALAVNAARAAEVGATLLLEGRDFRLAERTKTVGGQVLSVQTPHGAYRSLELPLFGENAGRHAAAAIVALEALLGRPLSEDAVRAALAAVRSPGRLEVVGRHPLVVLDGAHNPAAAGALASALPEAFVWDRLFLVLAVSSNKDLDGLVEHLAPLRPAAVLAASHSSPRSFPPGDVARACRRHGLDAEEIASVPEALAVAASRAGGGDLILVTGSLYTVADARRTLSIHA
jgi:dihydrofolate synthase/folylpolyglutamate synthase